MPIRVHCPACDDHFVTSRRFRGKSVRCPLCSDWIKIRTSKSSPATGKADSDSDPQAESGRLDSPAGSDPAVGLETPGGIAEKFAESGNAAGPSGNAHPGDVRHTDSSFDLSGLSSESDDGPASLGGSHRDVRLADDSTLGRVGLNTTPSDSSLDGRPASTGAASQASDASIDLTLASDSGSEAPGMIDLGVGDPGRNVNEASSFDTSLEGSASADTDEPLVGPRERPSLLGDSPIDPSRFSPSSHEDDSADEEVPLDGPPRAVSDGSKGSIEVLDYLAESGGPQAARPGAVYVPKSHEGNSRSLLDADAPAEAPPAPPAAQPAAATTHRNRRTLAVAGGGAALLSAMAAAFYFWPAPTPRVATPSAPPQTASPTRPPAPSKKPPASAVRNKKDRDPAPETPPVDPFEEVAIESATIDVRHGWFSDSTQIELSIRNDADVALQKVELRLEVVAGVFESVPLAEERIGHEFSTAISPGGSESIAFAPGPESRVSSVKLPTNARLKVTVADAKWVGR